MLLILRSKFPHAPSRISKYQSQPMRTPLSKSTTICGRVAVAAQQNSKASYFLPSSWIIAVCSPPFLYSSPATFTLCSVLSQAQPLFQFSLEQLYFKMTPFSVISTCKVVHFPSPLLHSIIILLYSAVHQCPCTFLAYSEWREGMETRTLWLWRAKGLYNLSLCTQVNRYAHPKTQHVPLREPIIYIKGFYK